MKKVGKVILRILLVLIILLIIAGLFAAGAAGLGPLKGAWNKITDRKPGNQPAYSFEQITEMKNSPLEGKTLCVLGSSVTYGMASGGYAIGEYLSARFGMDLTKEAVGATTLADVNRLSYVSRMERNLPKDAKFDLFICQLSTNDATFGAELGTVSKSRDRSKFDRKTTVGAMEYIISYVQETWDCPVLFYTGARFDSKEYADMVDLLYDLQNKWDIGILDLWNAEPFNDIRDKDRELFMADDIHPTRAGYRDWWGPELEAQLLNYLAKETSPSQAA